MRSHELVDSETERGFVGREWKWNFWEDIGNDDNIQPPPKTDLYDGPHGLKSGVGNRFKTILQCIMTTKEMNIEFFKDLCLRVTNVQGITYIQENKLCILDTNGKYFSK